MSDRSPMQDEKDRLAALIDDLQQMKTDIADVEIPGWTIGKPTLAELSSNLVIIIAKSKIGTQVPFNPPFHAEAAVAVLEGSVQINSGAAATFVGGRFYMLPAGEHREILALEHPTRICCLYFRTGAKDGGPSATGREVL